MTVKERSSTTTAEDVEITASADEVTHTKKGKRGRFSTSLESLIKEIQDQKGKEESGPLRQYLDQAERALQSAVRELNWYDGNDAAGNADEDEQKRRDLEADGRDAVERRVLREEIVANQGGEGALKAAEKEDAEKADAADDAEKKAEARPVRR